MFISSSIVWNFLPQKTRKRKWGKRENKLKNWDTSEIEQEKNSKKLRNRGKEA